MAMRKRKPKPKYKTSGVVAKAKRSLAQPKHAKTSASAQLASPSARNQVRLGQLWMEKCELREAKSAYELALGTARRVGDWRVAMEALAGLLRVAGEELNQADIERVEDLLSKLMAAHPGKIPPKAWFCRGVIATLREQWDQAQRQMLRYIRASREYRGELAGDSQTLEEDLARGWISLANIQRMRGHDRRAGHLARVVLVRFGGKGLRGIEGVAYLLLGRLAERAREFKGAMEVYQKAHTVFLAEHNWYHYLYVLYGYARVARMEQNYPQAYAYLDMIDKAAAGSEFGVLRREIAREKTRLEHDAVDLLIDGRKGIVKTREGGTISLRKQYILLHLLEALSAAHERLGPDRERGLSKAEIVERVWGESYRPEAHDNKLYYNINRLRKLIEPDVRQPQYLLNWKEGYRLAPGLRIHAVASRLKDAGASGV